METLHHVAPLLPSVGRINGRGSCILLSMTPDTTGDPSKCRAILLTTSHCLTRRVDAHGLEAIFFENPLEGSSTSSMMSSKYSRRGTPQQPVVVLLRPEQVFITSAEDPKAKKNLAQQQFMQNSQFLSNSAQQQQQTSTKTNSNPLHQQSSSTISQESSVGYTIVACDVEGRFVEKFQQQQALEAEMYKRRMSTTAGLGLASGITQQQQNTNNNTNLVAGSYSTNSDYGLDPLGTPDAFQTRTASKYRPLFDKKAIERAAQARLEEVTRKQQEEQEQQEEAEFRKSILQKSVRGGGGNALTQNFHNRQNSLTSGRTSSSHQRHESFNNNNNDNDSQEEEGEGEEDDYYYDEILQKFVQKPKKRPILAPTASFHRTHSSSGLLIQQQQHPSSNNLSGNPSSPSSPVPPATLNRVSNPSLTAASNQHAMNQAPPTISSIIPIGLPLIQSRCPRVQKGDRHLVITHADGGPNRRIYSALVSETHEGYCVYLDADATIMFSSGGLVFSTEGEFIGVQHQSPGPSSSHYCMYIKEITQHLFLTHSLSSIQIPILDGNVEDVDGIVGTVAKSVLDRDLFVLGEDPLWKRQRDALIRGNQIDPDMLSSAPPTSGILTGDARTMHVRLRSRYGGNYSQLVEFSELEREQTLRHRYIPKTLLVCDHLQVFEAYYKPDDYSSLVHMVGSFGYHPALTKLMLTKLVSHEHRNDLQRFAECQGMPPLLEVLERNGESSEITQAAVTALGRLTQFELNREAMNRYNGIQTLLAILQGWPHHVQIIEWGCFCLMNMTAKTTLRSKENIKTICDNDGASLICGFVKNLGIRGPSSAHICRWGLMSLSHLIGDDKSVFDRVVAENNDLCSVIVDGLVQFSTSSYALHGVSECFLTLVHLELYDAAVDFFVNSGALSRVLSILQALSSAWMAKSSSSLISSSIVATINAHSHTGTYEYSQQQHHQNQNKGSASASASQSLRADDSTHKLSNISGNHNNSSSTLIPLNQSNSFEKQDSTTSHSNQHQQQQQLNMITTSLTSNQTATSIGSSISSSFGSAADAVVAQNFLTAFNHIVQQRPHVKTDMVYLGAAEIASACARVFAKEGELVSVVASLMNALS